MDLHHQYAVKIIRKASGDPMAMSMGYYSSPTYIAKGEKDEYTTTTKEGEAHTSWSRQGAARMAEDYLKKAWNVTMGEKPTFEIVKVKRPVKIHHPW